MGKAFKAIHDSAPNDQKANLIIPMRRSDYNPNDLDKTRNINFRIKCRKYPN